MAYVIPGALTSMMNLKNLAYILCGFIFGLLLTTEWSKVLTVFNDMSAYTIEAPVIWSDPCLGSFDNSRKKNLMSEDMCIKENKTIFFLETNPEFKSFNGRRLCAFESAARHNPNRTVVVVLPNKVNMAKENTLFMEDFPNMYVHHLNYTDIIGKSPQAKLLEKILAKNNSINVHISDVMRPFILSKHGGAYMDSDTVSLKYFPDDIKNFMALGVHERADLNNGVLSFDKGNKFLLKVLEKMADPNLRVKGRNALGPQLYTQLHKMVCPERNYDIQDERVQYFCPEVDLLVLKKNQAHMWESRQYAHLGENMTLPMLMDGIKDSFVIHYFGSHYDGGNHKLKESSPLIGIMEDHCPTAAEIIKSELKS